MDLLVLLKAYVSLGILAYFLVICHCALKWIRADRPGKRKGLPQKRTGRREAPDITEPEDNTDGRMEGDGNGGSK